MVCVSVWPCEELIENGWMDFKASPGRFLASVVLCSLSLSLYFGVGLFLCFAQAEHPGLSTGTFLLSFFFPFTS